MELNELNENMKQLQNDLMEYKASTFSQLTELDRQISTDRHNNTDNLEERLSRLECRLQRPDLGKIEKKSHSGPFASYLRSGTTSGGSWSGREVKALSSDPQSGGVTIPSIFSDQILCTLKQGDSLRQVANSITVSHDAAEIIIDRESTDVGWVSETSDRPETTVGNLEKKRIPVFELYAKPRVTQKLLDDTLIDIESWISEKIAMRMATQENEAFLHGDGSQQPKGILTYPFVAPESQKWGSFSCETLPKSALNEDDSLASALIEMMHQIKPFYLGRAHWVMKRSTCSKLRRLKERGTGQFLWQPSFSQGTPPTLLGHPVLIIDEMPNLDSGKPAILFGDFSAAYQIVDREGMNMLRDPYSAKPYVEFYVTRRVGGDVVNFDALHGLKITE